MFQLNLDENGYLLSVYQTVEPVEDSPEIESLDGLDLSGYRINAYRWDGSELILDEDKLRLLLAEEVAVKEANAQPTLEERNRADIDFLLAMGGYEL